MSRVRLQRGGSVGCLAVSPAVIAGGGRPSGGLSFLNAHTAARLGD